MVCSRKKVSAAIKSSHIGDKVSSNKVSAALGRFISIANT